MIWKLLIRVKDYISSIFLPFLQHFFAQIDTSCGAEASPRTARWDDGSHVLHLKSWVCSLKASMSAALACAARTALPSMQRCKASTAMKGGFEESCQPALAQEDPSHAASCEGGLYGMPFEVIVLASAVRCS